MPTKHSTLSAGHKLLMLPDVPGLRPSTHRLQQLLCIYKPHQRAVATASTSTAAAGGRAAAAAQGAGTALRRQCLQQRLPFQLFCPGFQQVHRLAGRRKGTLRRRQRTAVGMD